MAAFSEEALQKIAFFKELNSSECAFLSPFLCQKNYVKDEVILQQGRQTDDLYLLLEGRLALWITLPGDITKKATELFPGDLIGEVAFLAAAPLIGRIICEEESRCLVFPRPILAMLRIAYPKTAYKIEHAIALQMASKVITNINYINELLQKLPDRSLCQSGHARHLAHKFAQCQLADVHDHSYQHLLDLQLFPDLSTKEAENLLASFSYYHYDKGYRFNEHARGQRKLMIINSGAVMLFLKNGDELQKSIAVFGIGEACLHNFYTPDLQQKADFVTCERTTILELDYACYMNLQEANPCSFYQLSRYIHHALANLVYVVNRQFIRIGSEYMDLLR